MTARRRTFATLAEDYHHTARREVRRARQEARDAELFYKRSRETARHAAWLTRHADLWDQAASYTPAALEDAAKTWKHLGDLFLAASFRCTESAAHYYRKSRECRAAGI